MSAPRTVLVVPCYNEEQRLDASAFLTLLDDPGVDLLFVDDGSKDGTRARLQQLAAQHPQRIAVLALEHNVGKAETVRQGMRAAIARRADFAGYADADLATPASEIGRLVRVMRDADAHADAILGSRIALLGSHIERNMARHYVGRVFATAASIMLRIAVYDTQCGAKVFRCTPALSAALSEPFISRWAFDVELLGRLLAGTPGVPALPASAIREEPLLIWRDIAGSKLGAGQMARSVADLVKIERDLRRRRALAETAGTPEPD